jgi:DNA-binding XRE family transcriptional regulator
MAAEICVSGNIIESVADIGCQVRQERKRRRMTQADFAMSVGVGRRFIIDLEHGKETIEGGKMLTVLVQAGFIVRIGRE